MLDTHAGIQSVPFVFKRTAPFVFKRAAAWAGVRLEHYRLGKGQIPAHRHDEHQIIIPLGGYKGELQTANGLHICAGAPPYSICVIPSGQHYWCRIDEESEFLSLYLDPGLVTSAAAAAQLTRGAEIVERCAARDPLVSNVGLALLTERSTAGLSGRLYAESLANILAIHLLRHYAAPRPELRLSNGGLTGFKLRRVTEFITENYERDLALAEMARTAGVSPFHFAREFKRATGLAPHQYLIKVRLERAKAWLADSELPIVEIGLRAGFNNQSHFTRLFHKHTGMTPKSYRKTFQH